MDAISNDDIREVVLQKSARVGYTKIALAAVGYFAHHRRRNQALWQPVDDDVDEFVKTELDPMLRDVVAMRDVFPESLQRDKRNTLRQKMFMGSVLHLRGGKAAKNYRRISIDTAYIDELDGFDMDVDGEGSPVTLAAKRIEGAVFPKLVLGSTPKHKFDSLIEARMGRVDRAFRFHVPCRHCGERHQLTWGGKDEPHGFKWDKGAPETVRHLCPHCGTLQTQGDYLAVWNDGRWIDAGGVWIDEEAQFRAPDGSPVPAPAAIGFHIWTAYSPMQSWSQIVKEWESAKQKQARGDKSELKSFINTTLGETWEEESESADSSLLQKRAEMYPLRTVPEGGLILTAAVDVQDNRFEVEVVAWGRDEESWTVDYTVLTANPGDDRDWLKLDEYLESTFHHVSGHAMKIEATVIDTGGHFTHQVYGFTRTRAHRRIFAVKGETKPGQPVKGKSSWVDVNYRGAVIKKGARIWWVGTDTAKDVIFNRMKLREPGPGYMHFSTELPDSYFEQLTSEARVKQRSSRGDVWRWVKRGLRNEALDCRVYNVFAAHLLDLHRYTGTMWSRLEKRIEAVPTPVNEIPQPVVQRPQMARRVAGRFR
jgi:terminase, large subunit